MKRIYSSFTDAIAGIKDGSILMFGGFGLCGIPHNMISTLVRKKVKNLTIISNNCSIDDRGIGPLLENQQIKKMIGSYVGENKEFDKQVQAGKLEVELLSQGALAEKIRAGGAGVQTFYTPAAVGTELSKEKNIRFFYGKHYLLEKSLRADFSIIRAWKGDRYGNLIHHKAARNFNSFMAAAGDITIAEVEQFVEIGSLEHEKIHTPGDYIQTIVTGSQTKRIKRLAVRK